MNLLQRIRGGREPERSLSSVDDYLSMLYGPTGALQTTLGGDTYERAAPDFTSMASHMFGRSSVVFACMLARLSVFSATRFQYQRYNQGRPSELFGDPSLGILERPWEGGTTGDLLTRMIVDADLAGNSYWTRQGSELVRLRPDWVDIVLEPRDIPNPLDRDKSWNLGWRKLGYAYWPEGQRAGSPVPLHADQVAHFCPIPDPLATYRGMSWLTPLIREVAADDLMIRHKEKFFTAGATPNMIVSYDKSLGVKQAREFKEALESEYAGVENAYKMMHLGGGADATVVGANFEQMAFDVVQAHGETRIAAAAGVPPIIAGFSKGLDSSTYSNYGQSRRRFADGTMHPLWGNVAGSLERIRPAPSGARLWYDSRDVPFLREDSKDAADIAQKQATTMATLVREGYEPKSVQRAVMSGDFGLLDHTGLVSVQLRPPGADAPEGGSDAPATAPSTPAE